mmetsp:Transcript_19490/g.42082  ORF Transcript_19490/g.42082 Transcript_19490/m.42082 type:complete len:276 (+) Transcript_19490:822-1649(+)
MSPPSQILGAVGREAHLHPLLQTDQNQRLAMQKNAVASFTQGMHHVPVVVAPSCPNEPNSLEFRLVKPVFASPLPLATFPEIAALGHEAGRCLPIGSQPSGGATPNVNAASQRTLLAQPPRGVEAFDEIEAKAFEVREPAPPLRESGPQGESKTFLRCRSVCELPEGDCLCHRLHAPCAAVGRALRGPLGPPRKRGLRGVASPTAAERGGVPSTLAQPLRSNHPRRKDGSASGLRGPKRTPSDAQFLELADVRALMPVLQGRCPLLLSPECRQII